jgi:hypothetical protein
MRGISIIVLLCVAVLTLAIVPAAFAAAIDVTDISPDSGNTGETVHCTVYGVFNPVAFQTGQPQFTLDDGITTIHGVTTWFGGFPFQHADVSFAIPDSATLGWYDLEAEQQEGATHWSDILLNAFYVDEYPVIDWVEPEALMAGAMYRTIVVHGRHFYSGFLGSEILVNRQALSTTFHSSQRLSATIPAYMLAFPGQLRVEVRNPGLVPSGDRVSNIYWLPVYAVPTITSISPTTAAPGGPAFTLDVYGANFLTGAYGAVVVWTTQTASGNAVYWTSTDLVTVRDSATHLRATVPASLIAKAGTATVLVRNGVGQSAAASNGAAFTIVNPTPALAGIAPSSVWAGYVKNDIVLSVTGSNFLSGAHIALGGVDKTNTTFVSATQVTVPLAAADIATAGTVNVSVKNPPFPPGFPSATTLPLTVQAETTVPQVSIAGADAAWHNSPVLLSFAATDSQSGVQKVQYMSAPAVPGWTDGTSYTVPTSAQGAITVDVQALDWCNKAGTASATVYIDTTQPRTQTLGNATAWKGGNARLKFRVDEPVGLSPKSAVVIRILRSDGSQAKKLEYPSVPTNRDRVAGFTCNLKRGTYKWYVYATDLAGNEQANVASAKLTVN